MRDKLFIIGNGFDIYHGIPSRFSDFEKHLRVADHSLYSLIEQFLPVGEEWRDLEEALAGIDIDGIVDYASQFLASYGAEDWSDAGHHDYQYEVDRIVDGLSATLKQSFTEWVLQLPIPSRDAIDAPLNIDPTSLFLTFNYTDTLSAVYGVPDSNVLFIHGKAEKGSNDLVLGHAWNPTEVPSLNDVPNPESMDTRVMEGNESLNDYFGKTFKDAKGIIECNISFFKGLRDISTVYVLGHSISPVDIEYFKAINNNLDTDNVKWIISYHTDADLERHRNAMNHLGVKEKMISIIRLGDLI